MFVTSILRADSHSLKKWRPSDPVDAYDDKGFSPAAVSPSHAAEAAACRRIATGLFQDLFFTSLTRFSAGVIFCAKKLICVIEPLYAPVQGVCRAQFLVL